MAVGDFVPLVPEEEEEDVDFEDQPELIPLKEAPSHNPIAPSDESFDIPTTVDPSYIISLMRKLLPSTQPSSPGFKRADVFEPNVTSISNSGENNAVLPDVMMEEISTAEPSTKIIIPDGNHRDDIHSHEDADEGLCHRKEESDAFDNPEEGVWEKYGCLLWDLASSQSHAELMVENLVLEVLLANLMFSKSSRITEICLGMIGNIACHEGLVKNIVSTEGLIGAVVEQLFSDDTQCLTEAFRLLTLALQGSECTAWVQALCPTHVIERLVWIAENTLNAMLLEKSVGLFLTILQSQQESVLVLIPPLIGLGIPKLLISLLSDEMSKLYGDSIPERYPVLDVILRAIEALSIMEDHSHRISFNKDLKKLICDLLKYPNKIEEASVTAVVLIANVLADDPDLALEMSQDLLLFQGLLDILPFTTNNKAARSALWTVLAQLLIHIKEREMGASTLLQFVSVLVNKSDIIEDDLLDLSADPTWEHQSASTSASSSAVATALDHIISILNEWTGSKDDSERCRADEEYNPTDRSVCRLVVCCERYLKSVMAGNARMIVARSGSID